MLEEHIKPATERALLYAASLSSAFGSRRLICAARFMMPLTIPTGLATLAKGRDALSTNEAAHVLNRQPQTLRKWACLENGPIRPVRINGRLAWKVLDLALLLEQP